MKRRYFHSLADRTVLRTGGGKARNMHFLLRHGFPVPAGWALSHEALTDFQREGDAVLAALRGELSHLIKPDQAYAVRSSAAVEDAGQRSCAGLFLSLLNVRGADAILAGIRAVWQSQESAAFTAYRARNLPADRPAGMAVIVQEMVAARVSGVAFSKNPLTGLSETIIEAGPGTGEDQAAARRDPERWVSKWGNWLERPPAGLIDEALARDLVRQTGLIARRYGRPVDLEWAFDGETLHFLQVRPITELDIPVFSNRIAREMLPGLIKPLVWSVNTRMKNRIWVDILTRLTGDRSFQPEALTGQFYYRAYFNMAVFGRVFERLGMPYESLELLVGLERDGPDKPHMRPSAGIVARLPRMIRFAWDMLTIERPFRCLLRGQMAVYAALDRQMTPERTPAEWLELAQRVSEATRPVTRFNILVPVEAMMYHRLLADLLKRHGHDIRVLTLEGQAAAKERLDPQITLARLQRKYAAAERADRPAHAEMAAELAGDVDQFIKRFGHFSDSGTDCSHVPWRETPDLIRSMILQPPASPAAALMAGQPLTIADLKLPWPQRPFIRFIYRRASRFAVLHEEISSLYTFGYGHFRPCFLHLGEQLAAEGVLENRDDIFYLYWPELTALVDSGERPPQHDLVRRRRAEMERYRDVVVPETIFGREQPPLQQGAAPALRGIPTSLGTYTGPARILQTLADFGRLNNGDVLVVPYSDIGWTPLFARAGAVIAESGGILSHSSIVAREYRIPAVVSVNGACRIADGALVTVNGYTGDILIDAANRAGLAGAT